MSDPQDLHRRALIRQAVVAQLTNRTSAGARVEPTRITPYNPKRGDLPAIAVYAMSEDVDQDSISTAPRQLTRDLTIEIAGAVAHSAALPADDAMDALAKEIEAVIDADPFLGGTVEDHGAMLQSTEVSFPKLDADPLIGIVTLTYSVTYYTSPAAAGNLDDFLRADVTTRIAGATDDNALHDEIVLQQEAPSP